MARPVRHLRGACLLALLALDVAACGGMPSVVTPVVDSSSPVVVVATPTLPAAPTSSLIPGPSADSSTAARVDVLYAKVGADPKDASAWRDLGLALLQRIRETADPSLYEPAGAALDKAHALSPDDANVLVGQGALQLARHRFADALVTGEAAARLSPNLPTAEAVVVDALVELGRYDEADAAVDRLAGLALDLTTLARYSYIRELHGDLQGAITAMRGAVDSRGLAPENTAYVTALLGNLLVYDGDTAGAETAYRHALALVPTHAPSIAGLGRLAVGRGDLEDAIAQFEHASAILPLPEYVIAEADAQAASGDSAAAARSYALARAEIDLFKAAGVTVDLDLALLEADHGDPQQALTLATQAYATAPTVRAADAVAWALHRLGRDREALTSSTEALRLGSIDPILRYHAGAIEAALGDTASARRDLGLSISTDPGFSAVGAAEVRRILATLPS